MRAIVDSLTDIPEPLRGEYNLVDGKYLLKVEGAHPSFAPIADLRTANEKLAEFRDNNRGLNTKVTTLEEKIKMFDGIDPAKYVEQGKKIAELEHRGVKGGDDVSILIQKAVEAAVNPLAGKLKDMETKEAEARHALGVKDLENSLREAGMKAGIDERAMSDYINRGKTVFKNIEGKVQARNGEEPIFSKTKPTEFLTMEEWAGGLQSDAPHLFKTSKGGGASGSNTPGSPTVRRIIEADPTEFGRNIEDIAKGTVQVNL